MSIIKKIKRYLRNYKINKRIKKYKFIHLMFNDKFNKPFVDFLNKNFDSKEHLILCKKFFKEFPFPEGENVIEIQSLRGLSFHKNKKIICHSLFDAELVDYLYKHQGILKNKAYWVIWGGDLYNAPRDEKNDFVRSNFRGYLVFAHKDRDVVLNLYGKIKNDSFSYIEYPLSFNLKQVDASLLTKNKMIKIQINNSCDFTTIDMLHKLAKFKKENLEIYTVLSYGQLQYKEEIIKLGKEIFAEKFKYIDTYLSPIEYAKHIASLDIFIANQDRQQATANIDMCFYFGNKVYIKSNISTFDTYKQLGYDLYDCYSIVNLSFSDFITKANRKNIKLAKWYTSYKYRKALWKEVFNAK